MGKRGSSYTLEWHSKVLPYATTNSTEAEVLEWSKAAKALLKLAAIIEATRMKPVHQKGYVDNDALRLAVKRGSSAKLGHLRNHGETCFRMLCSLNIGLERIDTTENEADILTKILSENVYLCQLGKAP